MKISKQSSAPHAGAQQRRAGDVQPLCGRCHALISLEQQQDAIDRALELIEALRDAAAYQARRAESEARRREEARNIPF